MSTMVVYTDGSCNPNPGPGGWAFIAIFDDVEIEESGRCPQTTNNIMEMTAVMKALECFPEETHWHIYSDSQYVINCAQGRWKRNKNTELWQRYDDLAKGKNIRWTWVKGHNGDVYNERVDKLARGEK